jgi:hypothetical protein
MGVVWGCLPFIVVAGEAAIQVYVLSYHLAHDLIRYWSSTRQGAEMEGECNHGCPALSYY